MNPTTPCCDKCEGIIPTDTMDGSLLQKTFCKNSSCPCHTPPDTAEEWKERFQRYYAWMQSFGGSHEIRIKAYEDFFTAELASHDKARDAKLVDDVRNIKKQMRCAACDGAKCEHTLGCKALNQVLDIIQKH